MIDEETEKKRASIRGKRREEAKRAWAENCTLPSTTYNPRSGWKIDEFAMYCDPDGLRKFKDVSFLLSHPLPKGISRISLSPDVPMLLMDYPETIHRRLLEPNFCVRGIRPDSYEPEIIPIALLEHMFPIIETSELLDVRHERGFSLRRYEDVRVFRSEPRSAPSKKRGRPEKFNYKALSTELQEHKMKFESEAALIRFLLENLRLMSTGKKPSKEPAWHTVKEAIVRYGLRKFVIPH